GIDLVRRAWARARLRSLLDNGAAPEVVLEHGRQFNQLTPRTSLLVLETWQDYEANGVPMPPDLRAEKEAEEREHRAREAERKRWAATRTINEPLNVARARWFITGTTILNDSPV